MYIMTEIQGKSIFVRVSARFQLARVRVYLGQSCQNSMFSRLLVVGLFFSKGQRSAFISGAGRTTRRYGRESPQSPLSPPSRILNPTLQHSLSEFREKNRLHAV